VKVFCDSELKFEILSIPIDLAGEPASSSFLRHGKVAKRNLNGKRQALFRCLVLFGPVRPITPMWVDRIIFDSTTSTSGLHSTLRLLSSPIPSRRLVEILFGLIRRHLQPLSVLCISHLQSPPHTSLCFVFVFFQIHQDATLSATSLRLSADAQSMGNQQLV